METSTVDFIIINRGQGCGLYSYVTAGSIWIQYGVLATSLLIQFPDNVLGKAAENGPNT